MIQQLQKIQADGHIQQPFFVKHRKNKEDHAGHRRYVKKDCAVHSVKEKSDQQKAGTQSFVKTLRARSSDMKEPYDGIAHHDNRDHPVLPGHGKGEQDQHGSKHSDNGGQ